MGALALVGDTVPNGSTHKSIGRECKLGGESSEREEYGIGRGEAIL